MISKIKAYLQGTIRYNMYYGNFKWMIRPHIKEQIEVRIASMKTECFVSGSCVECGCKTTALQMSNKACEGLCYPSMLPKFQWNFMKERGNIIDLPHWIKEELIRKKGGLVGHLLWSLEDGKFKSNKIT